ncbi:MAG TPA: modification methylase [Alphaproteobacteria bacterium]|nr:modification methylase [Alphaproteobacteria bacterium]
MAKTTGNARLQQARRNKKDEFYTQLSDIEEELKHYRDFFNGKTVFCNCDDPYESNFFKYFALNFNALGLKKLIATCYSVSPVMGLELPLFDRMNGKKAYKIEITEVTDANNDGAVDLSDVEYLIKNGKNTLSILEENGDFRSAECVELLKQADVVVTNPPFSLFREYVAQLIEYNKKFIIIGNKNSITYKEIFKLIKENRLWLGYRNINKDMWLMLPDDEQNFEKIENGKKIKHIMACWLTNIETTKRYEEVILYKKYTPEEYPKYDNYDAINVDKVADIPADYDGVMGVPITFLDKYNPNQFSLIGTTDRGGDGFLDDIKLPHSRYDAPVVNGKGLYKRLIIQRKKS